MRQARIVAGVVLILLLASGCTAIKRKAYEGFNRDAWQQPNRVVETLAIQPGQTIVDLGAGGGYFTFRLADAVGAGGTVYAADVDSALLDFLKKEAEKREYANVKTMMGEAADPKLPDGGADLIFLCNVYHHLEDRAAYFRNLKKYLRPGGRVAIVEFQSGMHSTAAETIRQELIQAGYYRQNQYDFLKKQNFQIFMPNP